MDDAALLAAVLAAPEDDAPRLVLADALMERGDPWGELIVISCELAQYQRAKRTLDERVRALMKRFEELYIARFPEDGIERTVERGFCTSVELRGGDLRALEGPMYALLEGVFVEATPERLDALARWPRLAQMTALEINNAKEKAEIRREVMTMVAAARGITDLHLRYADVTRDHIAAMLALPHAGQLRRLTIACNASLAGALGGLPWPRLDSIGFGACQIRLADVETLLGNETLHDLHELDVGHNSINDAGLARAIARVPWSRLDDLHLRGNTLGPDGLSALLASPSLRGLTKLGLGTDAEDLTPLLPQLATALPRLTSLWLHSERPAPGLARIALPYEHLDLSLPYLDPGELAALLAQPPLQALRVMWLSLRRRRGAPIGEQIATVLAAAPLPHLERLNVDSCGFGAAGARILAGATRLSRELDLTFYDDDLGDARAELEARFPYLSTY